jgi:bifunctional non-homologous end joining protein LigD
VPKNAASQANEVVAFGSRKVVVTHPDRVLFPEDGITKGDLVHYYRDVAHWLLPYVKQRPLTLQRWPRGIDGSSFFEKNAPEGMPGWIATTTQPRADGKGTVTYPMAEDAPSLTWFANLGSITFHVWMSRVASIDEPDVLLFDLDPFEGCTVRTLAHVALKAREAFDDIGLATLVKTTGGKGLHVVAPIAPRYTYDQARQMNELVARRLQATLPDAVTLERSKSKRARGTVYVDWAQLGQGKTMVPPYTVRARAGAPVSMPIAWSDVEALCASRSSRPTADAFVRWNMTNVPALLAQHGDPWSKAFTRGQRLEPALEAARRRWTGSRNVASKGT